MTIVFWVDSQSSDDSKAQANFDVNLFYRSCRDHVVHIMYLTMMPYNCKKGV